MSSRPLIKECLFLLDAVGVGFKSESNYSSQIRAALTIGIITSAFVNGFLECILRFEGLNSVESITVSIALYQVIIKFVTLIIHRKDLTMLLNKMDKFWSIDKYGFVTENEINGIYNGAKQMMKLMTATLGVLVSGFLFQPLLGKTRKLIFNSFFPQDINRSPDYELVMCLQVLMMIVGIPFLLGFDGLLISLIIQVTCELKLLKKGFETIPIIINSKKDNKEALIQLYKLVDHHNLILKCIKIMRRIYSILLLNVYLFNMTCICVGLFGMIIAGLPPTVESMSKYGTYTIFYTMQLFFYCSTGNYLTTECENVSTTVYDTKWWIKTQPELRKAYVLIILRSNKLEELTAGGMFSLSLGSFRKVLKSALSFFTLVEAIYKDETNHDLY